MNNPQRRHRRGGPLLLPALLIFAASLLLLGPSLGQGAEKPTLLGTDSVFTGMVEIPAGEFEMGVDEKWFRTTYLRDRRLVPPQLKPPDKETWWPILMTETPAHKVKTVAYAIDRFEVTNAQYLAFLDDWCQRVVFTTMKMNCLYEVAKSIFGENPTTWELESLYWLNEKKLESMKAEVLKDNESLVKAAIQRVNDDLPPPAHKKTFEELAERIRIKAWATFKLPEGTALNTYTRVVPKHWPHATPPPEEQDCPVRYVNALDADAFAEWAGKHLPTEEEWERAARGPENWVYPWGEEWICNDKEQKNLIVWNKADPAPRGPAAPGMDRPARVDICPKGQSGYGCFNMLGNVMEWTSSNPLKYPRSDAGWEGFGAKKARAVRGQSYGSGVAFFAKEISIRATARILDSGAGPINELNMYQSLGFRCAKYHTPARDVMGHHLTRLMKGGLVPETMTFDPARAFGVELPDYVAAGAEGKGKVYVRGETRFLGIIPVEKLDFSTAKAALASSADGKPVILAYLQWDPMIQVEALVMKEAKVVAPPVEDAPTEGAKPAKPAKPAEGEEPAPAKPALPSGPQEVLEPVLGTAEGFLLGIVNERLALLQLKFEGPELYAYLPGPTTDPARPVLLKASGKDFREEAFMAADAGSVNLKLGLTTGSKSSRDVFDVAVLLKVKGAPAGAWMNTKAE